MEDDEDQYSAYKQALDDDELQDKYVLIWVKNSQKAVDALGKGDVHAAIMDLKIPEDDGADSNAEIGIRLLKNVLKHESTPAIVVSANIGELDAEDEELPKYLEKFPREAGVHSRVFEHFETIHEILDIVPQFNSAKLDIAVEMNQAFGELWGNWTDLNVRFHNKDRNNIVLKRHVGSYLTDKWLADDVFGELHFTEFYSRPKKNENIHTGDILRVEEKIMIVVTAPCDLSNDDFPEEITLLECVPIEYSDKKFKEIAKTFRNDEATSKQKEGQLKTLANQFTNPGVSKHIIPPWNDDVNPHSIMFKKIKTLPFNGECRTALKEKRVATLSNHFMPNVLQRYGAYISRLGQPEVHAQDYLDYIITKIPNEET